MKNKTFHATALSLLTLALASCGASTSSSTPSSKEESSVPAMSSSLSSEKSATSEEPSKEETTSLAPTTSSSETPTQSSEQSQEQTSEVSSEQSSEASSEQSSEASSEQSSEQSSESSPAQSSEQSSEASSEQSSEASSEKSSEASSEQSSEGSSTPATKVYKITFKNADGQVLKTYDVEEGDTPVYDGDTPTKAKEAKTVYIFDGWDKEIVAATKDETYTATFLAKKYNDEAQDYASLKVNGPTNELTEEFAYGADLSMVAEVEKHGGVYYNEDGIEEDVFQILARDGVNYARFRLWNDPKSSVDGAEYGGGNNDLATDIALAKRAKAAGMKVMIDFHYSDSWADPIRYQAPKAWKDKSANEIPGLVEDFTKDSLQAFKDAGVTVDSVQIGNESNSGIAGVTRIDSNYTAIYASGIAGAKSVFPSIKTIVHLTQTSNNYNSANTVLGALKSANVDYDIVGVSYYSYYHGSQANYFSFLQSAVTNYGKPVICAETSYGFTDDWVENVTHNAYWSPNNEIPGGYATGAQGQASLVSDIVDGLSKISGKNGIGVFYWQPDWLPVAGAIGTSKAAQYYIQNGVDGTAEQIAAKGYSDESVRANWCNQALFSYTGKALPSASVYKHIQDKDREVTVEDAKLREDEFEVSFQYGVENVADKLPEKAVVETNIKQLREVAIAWDSADIAAITGVGTYTVDGVVNGNGGKKFNVTATVHATGNLLANGSFEDGNMNGWTISNADRTYCYETNDDAGLTNVDGSWHVKWWYGSTFSFTFSQKLTAVPAGTYELSGLVMAAGSYESLKLWYQIGTGEKIGMNIDIVGWNGGVMPKFFRSIEITEESDVTIGLTATNAAADSWGHCDKFSFSAQ